MSRGNFASASSIILPSNSSRQSCQFFGCVLTAKARQATPDSTRARRGGDTQDIAEHSNRSKLSDYATARRKRPTKAREYATATQERPAKAGEIAERVAPEAEQGSPLRPASDLRREHGNPVGKSASVEKAGQPGDSGESGRAFVSEPVAAPPKTHCRLRLQKNPGEPAHRGLCFFLRLATYSLDRPLDILFSICLCSGLWRSIQRTSGRWAAKIQDR